MAFLFYLGWIAMALAAAGGLYAILAAWATGRLLGASGEVASPQPLPAMTLLKPLFGVQPGLEDALASFLAQDYPAPLQIVFGIHNPDDPAAAVVRRLMARFPEQDIALVADSRSHGNNAKISNLINMMEAARHDILVVADSDISAPPGYLKAVVELLMRPGVGTVSCLYHGVGTAGLWSRLVAMDLSYHFLPNAAVGIAAGLAHPCFGSTIALTRPTLAAIGGFEAFADTLADDYEIGRAVRLKGLAIAYPGFTVAHGCSETSAGELARHELRWARTIRLVDPAGHWGSVITHPFSLGLIGAALLRFSPAACVVLVVILAARLFLKARIDHIVGTRAGPLWLVPVRDVLSFAIFVASLFGNAVDWGGVRLRIRRDGVISGR